MFRLAPTLLVERGAGLRNREKSRLDGRMHARSARVNRFNVEKDSSE